jgi:hypothetical protein
VPCTPGSQGSRRLTSVRSRARDATRQLYNLETQQAAARVACSAKVRRGHARRPLTGIAQRRIRYPAKTQAAG